MKKLEINPTFLPRFEGGDDSVANVIKDDRMAPTPRPARKRKMHKKKIFGTNAAQNPETELSVSPMRRIGRLPI